MLYTSKNQLKMLWLNRKCFSEWMNEKRRRRRRQKKFPCKLKASQHNRNVMYVSCAIHLVTQILEPFPHKRFLYIYIFILICYVISFSLWFTLGLQQSGILVLKVCIDMARDWKQTTMTKRFIKQKNRNKIHWIENLRKLIETEMEKKIFWNCVTMV